MTKVLIFVTNHPTLGTTNEQNGTYAPEITHALSVFLEAGFTYDLASIKGGNAPLYGTDDDEPVNQGILANDEFQSKINNTIVASHINAAEYDAVFYPGGFGLLSDLSTHEGVAKITANLYDAGKVVGAVCHGPAGLLPIVKADGTKLLANKQVTGFTREEEIDFGTIENIPFLLEESLTRNSAKFSKVAPWAEHVVVDGQLVTGQNPASAHAVGKAMVKLMG